MQEPQALQAKTPSGLRLFVQTVLARAYPRIVAQHRRERSWIIFDVILPVGAVAAYVFVYRAIGAPEEYVGFVVIGGAMLAFWMNVLWSMSSQLYWEKEQGNLALYTLAPASLMAILMGMAFGGMTATILRAVIIILVGILLFKVHFMVSSIGLLILVFFVAMAALYGMGMLLASIFLLLNREGWHLANLAQEPVYLVSGFYFPIKAFGFWAALGASLIPLTLGLDAMRQLSFSSEPSFGFLSIEIELLILFALGVVFIVAARYSLSYMERLAVREGRLTDSRN